MDRRDSTLSSQTRVPLAEHGINVTEEGVARARSRLRDAEARTTPAQWQELRDFIAAASL